MTNKTTKGSGNIFADLGFGKEEASNLKMRSDLMMELERIITRHGWSQAETAVKLGVTQPRISDLKRGKIDLFGIDTLINMIEKLGAHVNVRVVRDTEDFPKIEQATVITTKAMAVTWFGTAEQHFKNDFWHINMRITPKSQHIKGKALGPAVKKRSRNPAYLKLESTSAAFSGVVVEDSKIISTRSDWVRGFGVFQFGKTAS